MIDIKAFEDASGDPCYLVEGHVDIDLFKRELAALSDYGEDAESVEEYEYSHTNIVDEPPSRRFPDGSWKCVDRGSIGSRPVTLAATWRHRDTQ